MHTNFTPNRNGTFTLFSLDNCEQCEAECCAPNAINSYDTEQHLKNHGLKKRDQVPGELSYCEEVDMAVCEGCYELATADED